MSVLEVKEVQKNLTCPICYQLFKNPKYLSCYHSYCEECLEKMLVQSKIICPECRKETNVPDGGVKEFATNFFINRLVDDLILKKKVAGEKEVKCDDCDADPVVSFCPECNIFLCNACHDHHKRKKKYGDHGVVPLTELRSNKDTSAIQTKVKIPMCKPHDEQLKFYCETCDKLVCMYCTTTEHNGHNHDTTKHIASKYRTQLQNIITPVEGMIQDLSNAHENIDNMMKEIRKQGDEVYKRVDEHYNELVEKLMKQKDQVRQQVHDTVSRKEKALTAQLNEVDSTKDELVNMKELNDALEKSSDHEALSGTKQVINHVQQITKQYEKLTKLPVQLATMEFLPRKESLPQFGHLVAIANPRTSEVSNFPAYIFAGQKVEVTIITKDSNGDLCSIGGEQVHVELKSFTGIVTVGKVRDNNNGTYTASLTTELVGEAWLFVSINSQQIKGSPYSTVVRNYKALCLPDKMMNNNGKIGQPWGIAFGKNGVWAVADCSNHCVYVFDAQDHLFKKLGSRGTKNTQFKNPCGVTFDNDNHLYVADRDNHRVQKFDVDNYMLQFGGGGSGDSQLQYPHGITAREGRVYIADKGNRRISVFQSDGQFCVSFGSGQLGGPYDVAVNGKNQLLLVADNSHHCIATFTLDGRYVSKFATYGTSEGYLYYPYSLASDLNGYIVVSDGNHRVSVFDYAGKFIHCFGSRGTASGQFNAPVGIALSPNGTIYVSDHSNRRIHIYSNF
ncbi:tripartite motif-containing protein 2-like [Dysidea avara]|uniref:tripartite motif-containing protein 2-like n=1 Tax=Dysidea avara TaxID=196820 RepID=UPI00332C509F